MAGLKSLAKETAIYGLSSIVGRFLNYLLVPVYTMAMSAQSGGYGVVTNVYAWVALMLVLLTCGMETGFFRFANKGEDDPMRVYSTTLLSVSVGALTFLALGLLFLNPIAGWLEYGEPSLVRGHDDDCGGDGCYSKHSFRLFALQEASH